MNGPRCWFFAVVATAGVFLAASQNCGKGCQPTAPPSVQPPNITIEGEIRDNDPVSGDTTTAKNVIGNPSNEHFYRFVPEYDGTYTFSTCGSKFDTYLRFFAGGFAPTDCPDPAISAECDPAAAEEEAPCLSDEETAAFCALGFEQVGFWDDEGQNFCTHGACSTCCCMTVVEVDVSAGREYLMQIEGYGWEEGQYSLKVFQGKVMDDPDWKVDTYEDCGLGDSLFGVPFCEEDDSDDYSLWETHSGGFDHYPDAGRCIIQEDNCDWGCFETSIGVKSSIRECWEDCLSFEWPDGDSYLWCAALEHATKDCVCSGADIWGAFDEGALDGIGEYDLAVREGWTGSPNAECGTICSRYPWMDGFCLVDGIYVDGSYTCDAKEEAPSAFDFLPCAADCANECFDHSCLDDCGDAPVVSAACEYCYGDGDGRIFFHPYNLNQNDVREWARTCGGGGDGGGGGYCFHSSSTVTVRKSMESARGPRHESARARWLRTAETKKVEDLKVGDMVFSYSPGNKGPKTGFKKVVGIAHGPSQEAFIDILTNDKKKDQQIRATRHHTFTDCTGKVIKAGSIKLGDCLNTENGKGEVVHVGLVPVAEKFDDKTYTIKMEKGVRDIAVGGVFTHAGKMQRHSGVEKLAIAK